MCTVTFIPQGNSDFVLTSNRDEAPNRISLPPEVYTLEHVKTLFPKDKVAGGSWIGASENARVLCVLNGGFEKHKRKDSYRLSRGVVVKDLLISEAVESSVDAYDLHDVEPFTLVIVDWNAELKLYELVWDGLKKHFTKLPLQPKIWSSSTLYNDVMKKERLQWFSDFKSEHKLNAEKLLEFHTNSDPCNQDYGIVMNRGFVKTTSVTQVVKADNTISMSFTDLVSNTMTKKSIKTLQAIND